MSKPANLRTFLSARILARGAAVLGALASILLLIGWVVDSSNLIPSLWLVSSIVLFTGLIWLYSASLKRAESAAEALRNSEERARRIIETANDAFISIDAGSRITGWNCQAEALFGWARMEVLGRSLTETIIPAKFHQAHQRGLEHYLATGEGPVLNRRVELSARHRDGHEFPVELTIWPVREGPTYQFYAFLHDITERRQAEAKLQMSEERFRMLVQEAQEYAIFLLDSHGNVASWNAGAERIKGYRAEEIVGQHFSRFYPEEDVQQGKPERELQAAVAEGRVEDEGWRVRKDGSIFWANVVMTALRDEAGNLIGFSKITRDLSDRKKAEEKLAAFSAKLERSNRELQDFALVASHDLQEPLRKVQAFGDRLLVKCTGGLGEEGRDYLDRMLSATGRMRTLIDDLLTFSRVATRAQPFVPVNLTQVANEVLSDLEGRLQQTPGRVEIGDLPTIEADPLQMRQLLQNLVGNGLKFHRPDVAPVIRIEAQLLNGRPGSSNGDGNGAQLCQIRVQDNGIGFDEKYLDRLFQVFQRLHGHSEYQGTGMGLAICRRIAERHGGTITARSSPGHGATFIVTLSVKHTGENQP